MFNSLRKALVFSLLLGVASGASALERTALLPADAPFHLRISNTTAAWTQLQKSSVGQLWVDPQFQDFLGKPDAATWQELLYSQGNEAEKEVLRKQLKMLTGEVIFATDMASPRPYIIAAMSEDDFLRSLELDDQIKDQAEHPFEIVKRHFQDVEIIQYITDAHTPNASSSWQAHLNNTLLLGYSQEWIERGIIQLQKETIKEPTGEPFLSFDMPLSRLIREQLLTSLKAGQLAMVTDPEILLDALGIMGVEHFSVKVEFRSDEMRIDSHLKSSDLTKGLFSLLDTEPAHALSAPFIPADISMLEVGRINLLRFWREIPVALTTALPAFKPQFDMLIDMLQQQSGVQIEQDLLANVGTQYLSFSRIEGARQIAVHSLELKNAVAFRNALETALAAPALQPQITAALDIQDFLDHTVYDLKESEPDESEAFGVAGDFLLYGHADGVRQAIRTLSSAGAANTTHKPSALVTEIRNHVPAGAFGYSAIDWKKNMAVLVREFSKPEYVKSLRQSWDRSASTLPPPDFSKLPPTEHLASFFNLSFQYVEAVPHGLHQRITLKY